MIEMLFLTFIGLITGTFGTLVGAGGGFLLVPALLLLYPEKSPEAITGISLSVVFFNALSGSLVYSRYKRIDYRSGLMFSVAAVPGAILGALAVRVIPRLLFDVVFGTLMLVLSGYLFFNNTSKKTSVTRFPNNHLIRRITDSDSVEHIFSYNPYLGVILSLLVGFVSSLLGIGGGIIHVPAMINLMNFPVHIATATSHFVLSIMAFAGSLVHLATGELTDGMRQIFWLSAGVIPGAQLGAALSKRIHGRFIIRALAVTLFLVGLRIILTSFL